MEVPFIVFRRESASVYVLENAGKIVDDVVTSNEEKTILKNELEDLLIKGQQSIDENVTKRWESDMSSDSWLSKNVRPMVLIFLVVSTVLMVFIDAGVISFDLKNTHTDLLQMVLLTCIGAYFGGRSIEKVKKG